MSDDAPQPQSLQLSDLQNAVKAIDHAAEQGAYKGWETIVQVLAVRNRLAQIVDTVQKQEADAASKINQSTPSDQLVADTVPS